MDNSSGAIQACIAELFKSMGADLFAVHGLQFEQSTMVEPTAMDGECFLSVLGASAEGMKVLCYIRFPTDVGCSIYSGHNNTAASGDDLRDLCGELNNQLVGKVKNRLLAYQCRLMLGLPTSLCGNNLAASCLPQAAVVTHIYRAEVGRLEVVVHSIIHNEFTMADQPDESLVGAVEEGTLDFF